MQRVECPHCKAACQLVTGDVIYPHRKDLAKKRFYLCKQCDAYVGCHGNTTRPLGRPANSQLRAAKMKAHAAFDPLWRTGEMNRSQAYRWLAGQLNIKPKDCHIGMFDVEQCRTVVEACKKASLLYSK